MQRKIVNTLFIAGCIIYAVFFIWNLVKVEQKIDTLKEIIAFQATLIEDQTQVNKKLRFFLSEAFDTEYVSQPVYTKKVTATAYTAREAETNSEPWITANGRPSRVGGLAVSRDLEVLGINLGDMVVIKGMGLFRVEDRMNKRFTNRIDILHANLKAARIFAKQELEIMWIGKS
jgi:3D (Asp-Asp-Asp) domain-containing protein